LRWTVAEVVMISGSVSGVNPSGESTTLSLFGDTLNGPLSVDDCSFSLKQISSSYVNVIIGNF